MEFESGRLVDSINNGKIGLVEGKSYHIILRFDDPKIEDLEYKKAKLVTVIPANHPMSTSQIMKYYGTTKGIAKTIHVERAIFNIGEEHHLITPIKDGRFLRSVAFIRKLEPTPEEIEAEKKFLEDTALVFEYTNYKGETAIRRVQPVKIFRGTTEYHPEEQWLMKAFDLDKQSIRDFAVKDIKRYINDPAPEPTEKCRHMDGDGDMTIEYDSIYEMRSSDMHCKQCGKSGSRDELIADSRIKYYDGEGK